MVTGRNPSDRGADSGPSEQGVAVEGEVETETVLGTVSRPVYSVDGLHENEETVPNTVYPINGS